MYLKPVEAAYFLGLSVGFLAKDRFNAKAGAKLMIPYTKQGKTVLYHVDDLRKAWREIQGLDQED